MFSGQQGCEARAPLKIFALLLAGITLVSCSGEINDLTVCNTMVVDESQQVAFSQAVWNRGDALERGRMVVDLAQRHRLVGVAPSVVRDLLGPNTCYVHYDDEPCYVLSFGGRRPYLAFPVAHGGDNHGKIIKAYLRSDASGLMGCLSI
jgi:hypothetical protein